MVTNNLFLFLNKIGFVWLFMYIFIVILNYRHILVKRKYGSIEDIKKSRVLAQIYLDQFFITNKFYTFFISILYIFCMVLIFIIVRYFYINDITQIMPHDNLYGPILQILLGYTVLGITLLLYKSLLIVLFSKEINKLCIYLNQFLWFYSLKKMLQFSLSNYIFGHLYWITHRLGTKTYKYPYYPTTENEQDWHNANIEYLFDDEVNCEIDNKKIVHYLYNIQDIIRKYLFIEKVFIFISYIFRFLLKHVHKLYQPFPYFILISVFIIELYNKEFRYIYLITFIFIIIKTKRDLSIFLRNRIDISLTNYFYKNTSIYTEQRVYICNKDKLDVIPFFYSTQNNNLFYSLDKIIEYIYNKNFNENWSSISNKRKGTYRRFWTIIGFIIITYYIICYYYIYLEYELLIFLLTPILIMIYTHYYTYYVPLNINNTMDIDFEIMDYKYNIIYNIIFWIFTIIQGYIYWLLLLKPSLIFMNTEILLELPYNMIKIVKIYTIDEKIMYLFQYFEYYIIGLDIDKDYIRYIMRLIDYKDFIDEKVMLKDIQVYIKLLIDNYTYNEYFQEKVKEIMVEIHTQQQPKENPWYTLLKNVLLIGSVMLTISYYNNIYLIIKKIQRPEGIKVLMKDIYIKTLENKLTFETMMNYIIKIFK